MVSSFVRFVVAKLRARKVEVPGQISSHRAFHHVRMWTTSPRHSCLGLRVAMAAILICHPLGRNQSSPVANGSNARNPSLESSPEPHFQRFMSHRESVS
jgi:hypothetical protein